MASPARAESGKSDPGKVYRYTSSKIDGSGAGDELLFVSGSLVEVLSKRKSDGAGLLLAFEMDGPRQAPNVLKVWELSPGKRTFLGTVESLPAEKAVRVEMLLSGRPAETVAAPVFPWTMSNANTGRRTGTPRNGSADRDRTAELPRDRIAGELDVSRASARVG